MPHDDAITNDAVVSALDYHTEGEPMRIVTAGTPTLGGATMLERSQDFARRHDTSVVSSSTSRVATAPCARRS